MRHALAYWMYPNRLRLSLVLMECFRETMTLGSSNYPSQKGTGNWIQNLQVLIGNNLYVYRAGLLGYVRSGFLDHILWS